MSSKPEFPYPIIRAEEFWEPQGRGYFLMSSLQKKRIEPASVGKTKYVDSKGFVTDVRSKRTSPVLCEGKSIKHTS